MKSRAPSQSSLREDRACARAATGGRLSDMAVSLVSGATMAEAQQGAYKGLEHALKALHGFKCFKLLKGLHFQGV